MSREFGIVGNSNGMQVLRIVRQCPSLTIGSPKFALYQFSGFSTYDAGSQAPRPAPFSYRCLSNTLKIDDFQISSRYGGQGFPRPKGLVPI